jgi:hypothetical protein
MWRGMKSKNASSNRMATEAAEHVAETVQEIVEEVGDTHTGADPEDIVGAIQGKWTEKQNDAAPPLRNDKAAEYARHISEGNSVTVVPATDATPELTRQTGPSDN